MRRCAAILRQALFAALFAALLSALAPAAESVLHAQPSCGVQNPGNNQVRSCTVTLSTTLQLLAQATLSLSSATTDIAGGAPATDAVFVAAGDTGLVVVGPQFRVQSNRGVSVTLVNQPQFTGPWAKPASDVHLGVSNTLSSCAGVGMTPLSTSPLGIQQGAPRILLTSATAVSSVTRQLCLRVWWRFATDIPGSYSLPLTLSVTAP